MRPLRSLLSAAVIGAALGASGLVALAEPPAGGWAPDPPAHASAKQWTIDITAKGGKVSADKAAATTLAKPAESPRVMGRFAVELWIGKELLDRVRFNVPLMGEDPAQGNRNKLPKARFDQGVATHMTVRIADHPRATYLLLVDRETGDVQKLAFPPEADGRLVPWKNGLSDPQPGDFADGGVKAVRMRDGGAPDAAPAIDAGIADAARD